MTESMFEEVEPSMYTPKLLGKDGKRKGKRGEDQMSLQAFQNTCMSGRAGSLRDKIMECFGRRAEWTSKELAQELGSISNTVGARLGELEKQGLVVRMGVSRGGARVWKIK